MDLDLINATSVRAALRAIRYGKSLSSSCLLGLDTLGHKLREQDVADSSGNREWILATHLYDTVAAKCGELRGRRPNSRRAQPTPERELTQLEADFAAGNRELEAWGYLQFRYFGTGETEVREAADLLHVGETTLRRRQTHGQSALAGMLRDQELALRCLRADSRPMFSERLHVVGSDDQSRDVSEILAEMLGAMRDDSKIARLSRAEVAAVARHRPADLTAYRLSRIAAWSQPEYRLDKRFVRLRLLVDRGPDEAAKWHEDAAQYDDLRDLLSDASEQAAVLIGPPGCGKSALLRRFELDTAVAALEARALRPSPSVDSPPSEDVTFYVQLGHYGLGPPMAAPEHPRKWLSDRWSAQYGGLPPLESLLSEGRMVLLLDGLNELPARSEQEYLRFVHLWKEWLHELSVEAPGNRAIFACRALDYVAPLSAPANPVALVRVEPLSEHMTLAFLRRYCPERAETLWRQMVRVGHQSLYSNPFFLKLVVDIGHSNGVIPRGRAALMTSFVRHALRREVLRDNPSLKPGSLITARDRRRVTQWLWSDPHELPDRGGLFPGLEVLAYEMQRARPAGEGSQIWVGIDRAAELLGADLYVDLLQAAASLGVLEENDRVEKVAFTHQLFQEFFAARLMAAQPEMELVRAPWREDDMKESLDSVVRRLGSSESLPTGPTTGWDETTVLAAELSDDAAQFVSAVSKVNLVLAGRCVESPFVLPRLPTELIRGIRNLLVERSRDPDADVRVRIDAAHVLGDLGDPRLEAVAGGHGTFVAPDLVEIAGGTYIIGEDVPARDNSERFDGHVPRHRVRVEPFAMGRYPVTNQEWSRFCDAGGYDSEEWWETADARAWLRGEGTMAAAHQDLRNLRSSFAAHPERLDEFLKTGRITQEIHEAWRDRLRMSEDEFQAYLGDTFPHRAMRQPRHWRDARFNQALQPVVGISWFEARAYCCWLSAQLGLPIRLPTEVEWEAAARGREGRLYPYGDELDPWRSNVGATHIRHTTPIGVFPGGDTPEGVTDMSGNVCEWTLSAWGPGWSSPPMFAYPYDRTDGREDVSLPSNVSRVLRGGSWNNIDEVSRSTFRLAGWPDFATFGHGMRVALSK